MPSYPCSYLLSSLITHCPPIFLLFFCSVNTSSSFLFHIFGKWCSSIDSYMAERFLFVRHQPKHYLLWNTSFLTSISHVALFPPSPGLLEWYVTSLFWISSICPSRSTLTFLHHVFFSGRSTCIKMSTGLMAFWVLVGFTLWGALAGDQNERWEQSQEIHDSRTLPVLLSAGQLHTTCFHCGFW